MTTDIVCGLSTFVTTLTITEAANSNDVSVNLVVALVSALIYAFINIGTKLLTSFLEKKGVISHENKEAIDDIADDVADDGKINHSNRN